ncbi:hypothetical protein HZH68_000172 [Vespula germanica]|uniref:Uncharacterized protein n=1 Tax=Vespula germanica TaxID=30212 RepID=A0A834NTK2_VESGE|nr:hypothetical protein HZH68_000172 [Vespula germanica]
MYVAGVGDSGVTSGFTGGDDTVGVDLSRDRENRSVEFRWSRRNIRVSQARNQPTKQPTNQASNQPASQPASQPVKQPAS